MGSPFFRPAPVEEAVLGGVVGVGVPPEALLVGEDPAERLRPAEASRRQARAPATRAPSASRVWSTRPRSSASSSRAATAQAARSRRGGSEPSPSDRRARARSLWRTGCASGIPPAPCARRGARPGRATRPLRRPSSNSKVGCALSSGKSCGLSTSSGPMLGTPRGEPEHLGPLLGDHLLEQRLGGAKKSSTRQCHAPPATPVGTGPPFEGR